MEAKEDVSVDLEITLDDSLLQLSLDCEPKDREETEEEEAAPHPVSSVSYVEELKVKSDLVLHEYNAITDFARYAELGLFHLFCQSLGLKLCFSGPTKAFIQKGRKKSRCQLMSYVGLEVAMPIVPLNCINDYWNSSMFLQ
jgi:hypothetical protein